MSAECLCVSVGVPCGASVCACVYDKCVDTCVHGGCVQMCGSCVLNGRCVRHGPRFVLLVSGPSVECAPDIVLTSLF